MACFLARKKGGGRGNLRKGKSTGPTLQKGVGAAEEVLSSGQEREGIRESNFPPKKKCKEKREGGGGLSGAGRGAALVPP